jgi:hypothetical protein
MIEEGAGQFGVEPESEKPSQSEPPFVSIAYRVLVTPCISGTLAIVASQISPVLTFIFILLAVLYLLWYSANRELAPHIRRHVVTATGLTYVLVILAFAVVPAFPPAWTACLITAIWLLAAVTLIRVVEPNQRQYLAGRYLDIALASTGFSLVPWAIATWFRDPDLQSFAVLLIAISMIPLCAERGSVARVLGTLGLAAGCVLVGVIEFWRGNTVFGAALVMAAPAASVSLLTERRTLQLLAQCAFGAAVVAAGAVLVSRGALLSGIALLIGGLAALVYAAASRMGRPRAVAYAVGFGAFSLVLLGVDLVRKGPVIAGVALIVLAVLVLLLRSWHLASRSTEGR